MRIFCRPWRFVVPTITLPSIFIAASLLGAMLITPVLSQDLKTLEIVGGSRSTNQPSAKDDMGVGTIVSRLIKHQHRQKAQLNRYSVLRTYTLEDDTGRVRAKEVVKMEYQAPRSKRFTKISAIGSAFIRTHVFKRLMIREVGRASDRQDRDWSVTPVNYTFQLLGREQLNSVSCFVIYVTPKRKKSYLFEGQIWISEQDFAIVKATGHLAKNPSFWIKRVDFERIYQKLDGFWLPAEERSTADVRIYGKRVLTIRYANYTLNSIPD